MIRFLLTFSFLLLSITFLFSQTNPDRDRDLQTDEREDGDQESLGDELTFEIMDTSYIFYFYEDTPENQFPFNDTLLDTRFSQYDPTRQQTVDYFTLGNLGSAHYPIFYDAYDRSGFDIGLHQFDLYKNNKLKYYKVETPYSEAFYSQGANQEDSYFKANFSRQFSDGINFSMNYSRINNIGAYTRAKTRNTSLALGLWFHRDRYDGYLTYINNVIQQQDNGGIAADTFFNLPNFDERINIPINLETANTRHAEESISYTSYLRLGKSSNPPKGKMPPKALPRALPTPKKMPIAKDSLATSDTLIVKDSLSVDSLNVKEVPPKVVPKEVEEIKKVEEIEKVEEVEKVEEGTKIEQVEKANDNSPKTNLILKHKITFQTLDYKFDDESVRDDSTYYGQQLVDSRGLRQYIGANNLSNYLGIGTGKAEKVGGLTTSKNNFEVGLKHRVYFLDHEPEANRRINNLLVMGKFSLVPFNKFTLIGNGQFNLWDNAGDYNVDFAFGLNLKKAGKIALKAKQQRYSPSLIQNRSYISQVQIWDNDFTKPIETKLSASYNIPIVNVAVDGHYHLITNPIYYDTLATAQQFDGVVNIFQLLFRKNLTFGKWHLDNTVAVQNSSADIIRVPSFYTKNSLYFEGLVLKKKVLLLRTGLDLRMASDFFVPSYSEVIGQFHLQDEQIQTLYPIVDFALSFKVTRFRGFFRMDNITSYLTKRVYYVTHLRPLYERNFRAGLTWRFSG